MYHVWLHSTAKTSVVLGVGTYLGQGGPGSFVNLVNTRVEPAKVAYSWRFTRLTGHKKDNAELANGFVVLNKDGAAISNQSRPKLSCLGDVESEFGNNVTLWGHAITRGGAKVTITPSPSPIAWVPGAVGAAAAPAVGGGTANIASQCIFSASTLGQFLRSHEDVSGPIPKCTLVRPVFEMKPVAQTSGGKAVYNIQPGAPPGHSSLWLFTCKKIEIAPGAFVALG